MSGIEQASLRDAFAAAALQGWLASFGDECPHPATSDAAAKKLAGFSYAMADAMMAERVKERK